MSKEYIKQLLSSSKDVPEFSVTFELRGSKVTVQYEKSPEKEEVIISEEVLNSSGRRLFGSITSSNAECDARTLLKRLDGYLQHNTSLSFFTWYELFYMHIVSLDYLAHYMNDVEKYYS